MFLPTLWPWDEEAGQWREVLLEDPTAGPADTAAARIDVGNWLHSLPQPKRRIAVTLASGETTRATARKFPVSPGRISQVRRELATSWSAFQGEAVGGHGEGRQLPRPVRGSSARPLAESRR